MINILDMLTMPDVVYAYGYNLGYGFGFAGPYLLPSYLADTSFGKILFEKYNLPGFGFKFLLLFYMRHFLFLN